MGEEFDKLERLIDRELRRLPAIESPAPGAERIARVRETVAREASRLGVRLRRLSLLRSVGGVAAAIVLAVLIGFPMGPSASPEDDAATLLSEWARAVEDSSDRVAVLLSDGWMPNGTDEVGDETGELQELLESLDQALNIDAEIGV